MYSPQPRPAPQPPYARPPRRRQRDNGWTFWLIVSGVGTTGVLFLLLAFGALAWIYASPEKIASGVSVAGIPVGGESVEAATGALQQSLADPMLTVTDVDRNWSIPLSNLGVHIDVDVTVGLAQDAAANASVVPYYTIDFNQAQVGLFALSEQVNIDAVPGNPPQIGRALDVPVVLSRLEQNLAGELSDGVLELNMIEIQPPDPESVNYSSTEQTVHVVEAGQELGLIARLYGVTLDEILTLNDIGNPDLLYVGQELVIPAAGVYTPDASIAPQAPTTVGKSIVVSTDEQRIYAYENGQLVRSDLVSTGLPGTPTVKGDFAVYVKYAATDMSGPDYYLPQVPYTMYFYEGYGIHGTYWHNSFGRPMSHGCVNLPTPEAQWFYNWAEVGTPVRVI